MQEWMTVAQVCDLLQVHRATVDRWTRTGELRVFRTPSGRPRYHRSDVLNVLREQADPS